MAAQGVNPRKVTGDTKSNYRTQELMIFWDIDL